MQDPKTTAANSSDALAELRATLGADVVSLPAEFDGRQFADWSGTPSTTPLALIRPRTTEEVATALRICHRHNQPVVTQGGMTGHAGGACVLGGEVALSVERMSGVLEIDPVSATLTVLAGTPLQVVQEAAEQAGFMFALDLGARGSCTIGGNIATNAGGNRVIRYGMMRDQLLDVEAVLADGSVIGGRRKMIKNNTGYDLRNLLAGSEGTLAVITSAVLRLRAKPTAVSTAWCAMPNYDAVTALLGRAQACLPAGVSAFEVMWPSYCDFIRERLPELRVPLGSEHAYYVLLETCGADPERQSAAFEDFLADMLDDGVIADAALAQSEADAAAFWAIRDAPAEYPRLIPGRVSFDISFAVAQAGEAARRCDERLRARWPRATILVYGHLGDGNLHVVVQEPGWRDDAIDAVKEVVYEVTGELGGSVSAEHGIGEEKLKVLGLSRSPAELAAMKAIKLALDPRNILNPGKVIAM
ncbi:FAD-binding oxidoreductase [Paraburkholderia sp. MMS20-SJTR3]|uniref:FAD-binding oxidoreductase n=1 Tax=Paraburkholderia sejongensis TaxID=2886946 RepID=A0ABS8K181_9BURK|nr:FAD-binding oxidoreductase [Paraburkholderia sp. MMS20-SJTR3]MCC8395911.1 FAD-binding oxidoreductase [Paraburkholderia sp. MMS20-SJTR3]